MPKLYELLQDDKNLYMVHEYVRHGDLIQHVLEKGVITER
jgi:serine/threonine protein kinase